MAFFRLNLFLVLMQAISSLYLLASFASMVRHQEIEEKSVNPVSLLILANIISFPVLYIAINQGFTWEEVGIATVIGIYFHAVKALLALILLFEHIVINKGEANILAIASFLLVILDLVALLPYLILSRVF